MRVSVIVNDIASVLVRVSECAVVQMYGAVQVLVSVCMFVCVSVRVSCDIEFPACMFSEMGGDDCNSASVLLTSICAFSTTLSVACRTTHRGQQRHIGDAHHPHWFQHT